MPSRPPLPRQPRRRRVDRLPEDATLSIRTELAISEVVLSNGTRRYGVDLTIGSVAVTAGLDTGSTGLRVLPGVLPDTEYHSTGKEDRYGYGSGATFDGFIATTRIVAGKLSGTATVQIIEAVGCSPEQPDCAAGSIPLSDYGIQGDGLPGEGFAAILGINMGPAAAGNVFTALGVSRWLVELPRPGSGKDGRLVLNPHRREVAGFVALPLFEAFGRRKGGLHDAVSGSIVNDDTGDTITGAILLDTGAPGIRIVRSEVDGEAWPHGTPVTLGFDDGAGEILASQALTIGLRDHGSALSLVEKTGFPAPVIFAGLAPYFAFRVLYDSEKQTVGLKPRVRRIGLPRGRTTAEKETKPRR